MPPLGKEIGVLMLQRPAEAPQDIRRQPLGGRPTVLLEGPKVPFTDPKLAQGRPKTAQDASRRRFWWVLGIRPDGQESQQEVPQGPSGALGPAGGLADVFQRQPDGAGSARWTRIDSGQWSVYGKR